MIKGEKMKTMFNGKKNAKLGTPKKPAAVTVQTQKRAQELESKFEQNGWHYSIQIDPDKLEDITELEMLLSPQKTKIVENKVGRNAPCLCGSGKKHKKCCGK